VVAEFGDPTKYILRDGNVGAGWESAILTRVELPGPIRYIGHPTQLVTDVRCHERIANPMRLAFKSLYDAGLWGLLEDFGGCYCWRQQRMAPTSRSRHSWGIAIDLNVASNPFLSAPNMPRPVINAFEANGFVWGGNFVRRPDGMHFEYVDLDGLPS
jgi:hypothetical protein